MVSNTATVLRVINEKGKTPGLNCRSISWCLAIL
jgi:hypothetical protein